MGRGICLLALLAAASATLASCTSVTPAELRAADEARCGSYGFRPRTDAFATCLQRLDLARLADRREMMRELNEPMVVYPPVYIWR